MSKGDWIEGSCVDCFNFGRHLNTYTPGVQTSEFINFFSTMGVMEIVTGSGVTFKQQSTGGFWSWTVTANNTQGLSQLYSVDSIQTPFGRLVDVAVGIPSDVILAMADSISRLQQQLAPLLTFVQPFNPSISLTVTEGDPNMGLGAPIPIQNSGAFGSFMTATATPDRPWLQSSPVSINGIGQGEQSHFSGVVLPASLLSSGSPYIGHLNLQDNKNPSTLLTVTVTVTVLPRPTILASPGTINLSYSIVGGSSGGAQQLTVTNTGPTNSILNFVAAKLLNSSPWMVFTPTSGGPLAQNESDIITVSVVNSSVPTLPGQYQDIIRVTSPNASNSLIDVPVILTVS